MVIKPYKFNTPSSTLVPNGYQMMSNRGSSTSVVHQGIQRVFDDVKSWKFNIYRPQGIQRVLDDAHPRSNLRSFNIQ